MSTTLRAVVALLCLATVVASGLWLRRSGRPPNSVVFTIHKLVALAAAVFIISAVRHVSQTMPLGASEWAATVVSGVLFLSLAATGGLLSVDKPMPTAVQRTHQIVPYLTVLSSATALFLLLRG